MRMLKIKKLNENKEQIPNDKNDLNNEKIYKPNENDIDEDKVKTDIDENNDKDDSMCSNGSLSERDKRNFIIKAILILIVELCIIMLFLRIGFICDMNKPFIKSLGSMLGTFIPIVLILSLMSPVYILLDEMNWFISSIYIIIYIPSIIFLCFLLTNFTSLKCIIEVFLLFLLDFIVMEIYLFIFDSLSVFLAIIPYSIIDTIIVIIYYFLWGDSTREVINISIIAFVFILYLLVCIFWVEEDDSYVRRAIAISYGIFLPLGILIYGIICIREIFRECCGCCECECCDDCEC